MTIFQEKINRSSTHRSPLSPPPCENKRVELFKWRVLTKRRGRKGKGWVRSNQRLFLGQTLIYYYACLPRARTHRRQVDISPSPGEEGGEEGSTPRETFISHFIRASFRTHAKRAYYYSTQHVYSRETLITSLSPPPRPPRPLPLPLLTLFTKYNLHAYPRKFLTF